MDNLERSKGSILSSFLFFSEGLTETLLASGTDRGSPSVSSVYLSRVECTPQWTRNEMWYTRYTSMATTKMYPAAT